MSFTRRDFLRITVGAGLLATSGYLFLEVFRPSQLDHHETKTIEALLVTLIPDDETPGALKFGVSEMILSKAAMQNKYRHIIRKGSEWLDRAAGKLSSKGFMDLREEERDSIVATAMESQSDSLPRKFLELMRADAFEYYYSNPLSWAQLGYNGPPQPNGFTDYYKPRAPRL